MVSMHSLTFGVKVEDDRGLMASKGGGEGTRRYLTGSWASRPADARIEAAEYVARWAENKAMLRRNLTEVQGVAAGLIAGIEEAGLDE